MPQMNPEVAAALAPIAAAAAGTTPPLAGDWQTRRATGNEFLSGLTAAIPSPPEAAGGGGVP